MEIPQILLSSLERAPWGWSILALMTLAIIKAWPVIQLQTINAKAVLRGEKRDDLHTCNARLDDMGTALKSAVDRIHSLEMKVMSTVSAYRILEADADPQSAALEHARIIFREAWDTVPTPSDMTAMTARMP